jgi:hypothetical protein
VAYCNYVYNLNYTVPENDKQRAGYVVCYGKDIRFYTNYREVRALEMLHNDTAYIFGALAGRILNLYMSTNAKLHKLGNIFNNQCDRFTDHCDRFLNIFKICD